MTTRTEIINRALAAISAQADIVNSAENSKEAVAARLLYDPTRQELLRSAHWNFARKTANLTLLKSAPGTPENPNASSSTWLPTYPSPPWLYEYLYPADCMLMRSIIPQFNFSGAPAGLNTAPSYLAWPVAGTPAQRFVVATDTNQQNQQITVILTNQEYAIGLYTMDVTNENLWDSNFQNAMVYALASRFAMTISGDKTMARMVSQQAMQAINGARMTDGNEGLTINDVLPEWIRVRGFAGDWSTGVFTAAWQTPSFLLV